MDRWKRFVDWCQQPSKVKINKFNPRNFIVLITLSVILVSSITFGAWTLGTPAQTMPPPLPSLLPDVESNYHPGVSEGDYVIYGDYECNFSHPTGPEWDLYVCLCAIDWQKMEVIGVSGKEVIIRYTEQLKNGSASDHNG